MVGAVELPLYAVSTGRALIEATIGKLNAMPFEGHALATVVKVDVDIDAGRREIRVPQLRGPRQAREVGRPHRPGDAPPGRAPLGPSTLCSRPRDTWIDSLARAVRYRSRCLTRINGRAAGFPCPLRLSGYA